MLSYEQATPGTPNDRESGGIQGDLDVRYSKCMAAGPAAFQDRPNPTTVPEGNLLYDDVLQTAPCRMQREPARLL
jgi:hypothetical protein